MHKHLFLESALLLPPSASQAEPPAWTWPLSLCCFLFVLKHGTTTEAQNIPSIPVSQLSIMPCIFHKHSKKSRVLQKVLNFNSRCEVFQTILSFLMWMICVRNRPPSLSLLHPIPALLSCRGNRKDLPWMSILASSWSGLNLTRGHFMVHSPAVRVLQPPEKGDSIQTVSGERSLSHLNFQTPAGGCLGHLWVAWAKVVPGIIVTIRNKF